MVRAVLIGFLIGLTLFACSVFGSERIQLTTANTVVLMGEVNRDSVAAVELELAQRIATRGNSSYSIYLVINSPGGDVVAGEMFIQFAKVYDNIKTITIFAASMAAGIAEGLPGERLITENGVLMFHRAKGTLGGQIEEGELESRLGFWKKVVRTMEQRNASRMSLQLADYKQKVINEYWLYGSDAVEAKAADKTVDLSCSEELIKSTFVEKVWAFFTVLEIKRSRCPLL